MQKGQEEACEKERLEEAPNVETPLGVGLEPSKPKTSRHPEPSFPCKPESSKPLAQRHLEIQTTAKKPRTLSAIGRSEPVDMRKSEIMSIMLSLIWCVEFVMNEYDAKNQKLFEQRQLTT